MGEAYIILFVGCPALRSVLIHFPWLDRGACRATESGWDKASSGINYSVHIFVPWVWSMRCCLRCQSWIYWRTCTTGWCRSSVATPTGPCTKARVSSTKSISASIVQGSSIGPASYAVTVADLRPLHAGNSLVKFADGTYCTCTWWSPLPVLIRVLLSLAT